jgi:hypothetical protein
MQRHLITLAVLAVGAAGPAAAQLTQDNTAYGGSSAEFLLLGAGARGTALGGAFAALTTDVTALYYNPAGVAQLPRAGATVSTYEYLAGTRYSWAGMAFPMSGGARALGVSMGTFGFKDQPVYTLADPSGDGRTYSVSETFIAGTYAQNFSDRFSAGFTVKYVTDGLGETKASAFAVDFGTNFHATIGDRAIRAGFVVQNLGSNLRHDGAGLAVDGHRDPPLGTVDIPQEPQGARFRTTAWTLPVLFRVSVSLEVVAQGMNRLTLLSEFTQPSNTKPAAGAGLEWSVVNIGSSGFSLAARGSYTLNPDNQMDDIDLAGLTTQESTGAFTGDGLAVGGGLSYGRGRFSAGFDYAWKNFGPLGGTNFLTFNFSW